MHEVFQMLFYNAADLLDISRNFPASLDVLCNEETELQEQSERWQVEEAEHELQPTERQTELEPRTEDDATRAEVECEERQHQKRIAAESDERQNSFEVQVT